MPKPVIAATLNSYSWPAVRPETVWVNTKPMSMSIHEPAAPARYDSRKPDGGNPPLSAGEPHESSTDCTSAVALNKVGAVERLPGVAAVPGLPGPVPRLLVAVTVGV